MVNIPCIKMVMLGDGLWHRVYHIKAKSTGNHVYFSSLIGWGFLYVVPETNPVNQAKLGVAAANLTLWEIEAMTYLVLRLAS